jgi:hypothetical protein
VSAPTFLDAVELLWGFAARVEIPKIPYLLAAMTPAGKESAGPDRTGGQSEKT